MPFKSKAQARAAFGGYLGSEMEKKAPEFAAGGIGKLPQHVGKHRKDRALHDEIVRQLKK